MRRSQLFLSTSFLVLVALTPWKLHSAEVLRPAVTQPCTSSESWVWPQSIGKEARGDFAQFVSGKIKPVEGFSEGLALRRSHQAEDAKLFGEYWISRALFEGKMFHVALSGFNSLAARKVDPENPAVSFAALGCLNEIYSRYTSLVLAPEVTARLPEYLAAARTGNEKEILWQSAGNQLRAVISKEGSAKALLPEADRILVLLKGAGAHESLAKTLWSARYGDIKGTIREAQAFLFHKSLPPKLTRFVDTVHILLARTQYAAGQYEKSINQWKAVSKSSNELARSLSELAWAQLMAERYTEAIGTAMNLQQGGIRSTFAPESPMVMAMAMNELCQFPQSVYAIRMFHRYYSASYRWLNEWSKKPYPLYSLALGYLKRTGKAPERIASEWVRSPLFISHQDEINLLFDENDTSTQLSRMGSSEEKRMAKDILDFIRELKPRYHVAKMKLKAGQSLPSEIIANLTRLRLMASHYRNLQAAAPIWQVIMKNHLKKTPIREKQLVALINKDLEYRTDRMMIQLDEIAENLELVEVEIYNGASHDIIWQNAHPDYKQVMLQFKEETKGPGEPSWDWGRSEASEEGGEIWEDELGSFRANLFDNCSSKDKYLTLKMRKGRAQ